MRKPDWHTRNTNRLVLAVVFTVALLTRVFLVTVKHPGFPPSWGGEMSSVAHALAQGHGYSSPYWIDTGPTALVPPVYPFLLSLVFRGFGNHTPMAGSNMATSVVMIVPIKPISNANGMPQNNGIINIIFA